MREPSQVFTLLESVYNAFDKIAKKLKVFKVETIGDCYVAAGTTRISRGGVCSSLCQRLTRFIAFELL